MIDLVELIGKCKTASELQELMDAYREVNGLDAEQACSNVCLAMELVGLPKRKEKRQLVKAWAEKEVGL